MLESAKNVEKEDKDTKFKKKKKTSVPAPEIIVFNKTRGGGGVYPHNSHYVAFQTW